MSGPFCMIYLLRHFRKANSYYLLSDVFVYDLNFFSFHLFVEFLPSLFLFSSCSSSLFLQDQHNSDNALPPILSAFATSWLGFPHGPHSLFLKHRIDAISIVLPSPLLISINTSSSWPSSPFKWQDAFVDVSVRTLAIVNTLFRLGNGLSEKLHLSYFFYVMLSDRTFVPLSKYCVPLLLFLLCMLLRAFYFLHLGIGCRVYERKRYPLSQLAFVLAPLSCVVVVLFFSQVAFSANRFDGPNDWFSIMELLYPAQIHHSVEEGTLGTTHNSPHELENLWPRVIIFFIATAAPISVISFSLVSIFRLLLHSHMNSSTLDQFIFRIRGMALLAFAIITGCQSAYNYFLAVLMAVLGCVLALFGQNCVTYGENVHIEAEDCLHYGNSNMREEGPHQPSRSLRCYIFRCMHAVVVYFFASPILFAMLMSYSVVRMELEQHQSFPINGLLPHLLMQSPSVQLTLCIYLPLWLLFASFP